MVKWFGCIATLASPHVRHRRNWIILYFLTTGLFVETTIAIDLSQCNAPLGMESGAILDSDITASSSFERGNVGPHQARLKTENLGGAWCPKAPVTPESREWLEIDLHSVHMITGTNTQGRFGNGVGVEYAENYVLEYWRPRLGKWVRYSDIKGKEVIKGNTNTYIESMHNLSPPFWASKIRFLPYSVHPRTVCMRVEIYGCYWSDGVVSYSMPQGDKLRNDWEFFDATYDGHWDAELRRGLGQLTDGKIGPDNFKTGYYDSDRGQGWVGWRNDTRGGQPVEIKFEFDSIREFSAVHIYCNNQFSQDVQIFSQVDILFSIGGKYYTGEPITYNYMEDKVFEKSRNITIKLHHRVGKFVKLRLHFSMKWIMVSEVTFDSDYDYSSSSSSESSRQTYDEENEIERERRSRSRVSRRHRASRSHSRHRSYSCDGSRSCSRLHTSSHEHAGSICAVADHNLNQEPTNVTQSVQEAIDNASDKVTRSVEGDMTLDEETLLVIGKRLRSDKKLADTVHKDIQIRWEEIYKDGLPEDIKTELLSKHPQPVNLAFLEAPKLNIELKASVHESVANRDSRLVEKQEKVAACLSVVGSILSQLLKKEELKSIELIEKISDTCRILVDLQSDETLTRRSLVITNILASLKETLKTTEVDEFLFGKQLEEQVKAAKLLEKSTKELKLPKKTATKHVAKNTRGPSQQTNRKFIQSRPQLRKSGGGHYK